MPTDYYDLLGIRPDASADDMKRAYRRRARDLHPDANPDDPGPESEFKEVALAYEVLSDPDKRRRYDMFGPEGVGGAPADPFGGCRVVGSATSSTRSSVGRAHLAEGRSTGRSGPPRGADLETVVRLAFDEAVFGTAAEVVVRTAVVSIGS